MASASLVDRVRELVARARATKLTWRHAAFGLAAVSALSGIYFVPADQQAVVLRFGRIVESRVPGGVHWTWPAPIGKVYKLRVRETKRLILGRLGADGPPASQFLTGDRNILNVRVAVQFAIDDPAAYLFRAENVEAVIASAAEGALVQAVAERHVDDVLTTEKVSVQQRVQALAGAALARDACGVTLLGVVLDAIEPPFEVIDAFRSVASAREDRNRIVREAESYANGVVPVARGESAQMAEQAQSYVTQRVDEASGNASRFSAVAAEYRRKPSETLLRLYLEVMDEVLPKMDKTLIGIDGKTTDLRIVRGK